MPKKHRFGLATLAVALVALAGCGGSGSGEAHPARTAASPAPAGLAAACGRIPLPRVAALVRAAGGTGKGLHGSSGGSARLTHCNFRAPGVNAGLVLDGGREAVTRYSNRITEAIQFASVTPNLRPQTIDGLGDVNTPGSGANWIPAYDEMLSVRGQGALFATFYVRGAGQAQLRRGGIGLSLLAYKALGLRRRTS